MRLYENNIYLEYIYGATGIIGFDLYQDNSQYETRFWFVKNIQGDVTHIYRQNTNNTMTLVAQYEYDAWGNHTIGTNVDGIAELNPIRYRGYYWDTETGLYYLKSRYYDPETGRFISPDDIGVLDVTKDMVNGLNLYAYCGNDPINDVDSSGMISFKSIGKWFNKNIVKPVVNAIAYVGNVVGSTIELIGTTVAEIPSFINATFGSAANFLAGSNTYYSLSDWWLDGGYRLNNALSNLGNSFVGKYQTVVWSNMTNGFWNSIGWLNDNFSNTLEVLSWLPGIGVPMLFTPLAPVGLALCIIGGVAFLISILDKLRPNNNRPKIV